MSVYFLSLDSGQVIGRDQFTLLPMPDNVIAHVNCLVELSYTKVGVSDNQLDFTMGLAQTTISEVSHTESDSNLSPYDMDVSCLLTMPMLLITRLFIFSLQLT